MDSVLCVLSCVQAGPSQQVHITFLSLLVLVQSDAVSPTALARLFKRHLIDVVSLFLSVPWEVTQDRGDSG